IAETAELTGTVRAYKEDIRQHLKQRLLEVCNGIGATFGAEIILDYQDGYPPTVNAVEPSEQLRQAASQVVGAERVVPPYLTMAGEDMAYFLQEKPGCFFFIGAGKHAKDNPGEVIPHHCPVFDFDETALNIGARVFIQLVEDYLG
ncbi:MAG: M20/M25/M40 family metallo-hydrolase, partial [Candidatus Marinimicrobia bacterium]|nr:M20/M25/M40 family metallo-hydrolase [Candidatus Neomarinimicrobiota bacterium]